MIPQPRIEGGSGSTAFRCWTETRRKAIVVHVEGEVDLATAPDLADVIAAAFRHRPWVIVDLARVSYMDGSGIRVLRRAAEANVAHLAVTGSSPSLRRLFDMVHLPDVISLLPFPKAN